MTVEDKDLAKDEVTADTEPQTVNEEKETPQDSPTEQKTETTTPSTEGEPKKDNIQPEENLPFHKHPRWQTMNQRNKELEATVNDLLQFKQSVESKLSGFNPPAAQTPVPAWFKNLYGDNPQVWTEYQTYEKEMKQAIKEEAIKELKGEQEKQSQEVTKWNKWVDTQFDELEDSGKTFDRNELRKFILDYNEQYKALPLDAEGNIDISKCYDLMTKLNPAPQPNQKLEEKKKLAAKMASNSTTEAKVSDVMSLDDIRGKRNWRDF